MVANSGVAPSPVDILAVDDNPNNLKSLRALLGDVPATIVEAHSGDEALRCLLNRNFALILLDIQMPNLDGYETAELIRSRDRSKHIPIIFITAFTRNETHVIKGYSLGAVDFLFKPIVPEILRSKVNVFLDLYRKTKESEQQAELLREAERREHQRSLRETREKYERSLLQQEMERERKVAEALNQRAQELARLVEEKEKAKHDLHQSNERLALLSDSASRLLLAPRAAQLSAELNHKLVQHLGLDLFVLFELEEPGDALRLVAQDGLVAEEEPGLQRVAVGEGLLGQVARDRRSLVVEDAQALEQGQAFPARGLACYPLLARGRLIGALAFGSRKVRAFSNDEEALLQGHCDQLAVSLERDRLIEELRDADRRKDEFLAMLAHELRNPLAPIRNALEVFSLRGGEDPLLRRAIASADRQVSHMTRLVDDLLDVSRITRGKVELRKEQVALSSLVEQATQGADPFLKARRHTLVVHLPPEPVTLQVDATRLVQVLGNLLHNAGKYTDPGGHITLTCQRQGEELVVKVRDTGIGLRPEMLNRVFDAFVQADPSSDRAQGGLGLGLTLVRSLVEMHGGQVGAHSEGQGKGSEFYFRLPLPPQPVTYPTPVPLGPDAGLMPRPVLGSIPLNILLVEDNPDIRSTLRDLLELHGHSVNEAADGIKAVELVLAEQPNLALVDIGLPGMDGYRVAEMVRAAAGGAAHTRLVALTGYGGPEDKRRALEAGFDAHLVKPITSADLTRVIKQFF